MVAIEPAGAPDLSAPPVVRQQPCCRVDLPGPSAAPWLSPAAARHERTDVSCPRRISEATHEHLVGRDERCVLSLRQREIETVIGRMVECSSDLERPRSECCQRAQYVDQVSDLGHRTRRVLLRDLAGAKTFPRNVAHLGDDQIGGQERISAAQERFGLATPRLGKEPLTGDARVDDLAQRRSRS